MMAGISAVLSGSEVILIEKNPELGRKLLLTGGGRCNLTNACEPDQLIKHFFDTGNFLRDAFKVFNNKDLLRFFYERGMKTKVEEDGKVFPVTDKASTVLDILKKEIEKLNLEILYERSVKDVILEGDLVCGVILSDGNKIAGKKTVLATGGLSYKGTGSTGDGMKIAETLGHKIVAVRPGLVSLRLEGTLFQGLEGLSLDGAQLIYRSGGSKYISEQGSLMFTKNGITGPAALSSSYKAIDWIALGKKVSVEIDVFPDRSPRDLEKVLSDTIAGSPGKNIKNVLKGIIPERLTDFIIRLTGISPDKKANQVTGPERKMLVGNLKGLRFFVLEAGSFDKAQITRGGVSIKDINPKTMESKKIRGLYFAGETIDVDGASGGFNLQAAFSTGYLAGKAPRTPA